MELNFSNFETRGDIGNYKIDPKRIEWIKVNRNTPAKFFKKLETPLSSIKFEFILNVTEIKNFSEINRHLITLCKFEKENGTILSLYVSELQNSESEYKLWCFQRKDGENIRVYGTDNKLKIKKEYKIKIYKKEEYFGLKIYEGKDFINKCEDSGNLEGYDESYGKLIVAQGHGFSLDIRDESSGYLKEAILNVDHKIELKEDLRLGKDKLQSVKEDYEYDVFIAYYRISAKDFASHLERGLEDNELTPFRDETSIKNSEEWRKKRDEGLYNCKVFILLMTPGYQTRPELIYEIKKARENKIPMLYCCDANLSDHHMCVDLGSETINLKDYQLIFFNKQEELFRKVYYQLDEWGYFPSECAQINDP